MALKRITDLIIYLLICIYVLWYPGVKNIPSINMYYREKAFPGYIYEFIEARSEYGDFRLWENEKVSFRKILYDSKGNISGRLFNITNNNGIIGYVIDNQSTSDILEYALGLSPYDAYLACNNLENMDSRLRFIYKSPGYYGVSMEVKGKPSKVLKITPDKIKNFNPMQHAAKLAKKKGIIIMGSVPYIWDSHMDDDEAHITEEVLLDVMDLGRFKGCGPTAAANIVYYWDRHFPKLVSESQNPENVISELSSRMYETFNATLPTDFRDGLEAYMNMSHRYPDRFRVYWYPNLSGKKNYETLCSEINNNRPGALLYLGSPYWGNHYVNFVGYSRTITPRGMSSFYIVHDNWDVTPVNIYRNWYTDEPFIWSIFKIAEKNSNISGAD